jgi:hypothetical protein
MVEPAGCGARLLVAPLGDRLPDSYDRKASILDQPATSTRALIGLLLGLVSLPAIGCLGCGGVVLGIAAVVVGVSARRQIQQSEGMETGQPIAGAAIAMGAIAAALGLLVAVGLLVVPSMAMLDPAVQELFERLSQQLGAP